jgi:hypothetical protein
MDRPITPHIDHQQGTLDFMLDRLGLRDAHARVVEEDQGLAQRVDELTAELAEGELGELRRVVAAGLRVLETTHNGGGRR